MTTTYTREQLLEFYGEASASSRLQKPKSIAGLLSSKSSVVNSEARQPWSLIPASEQKAILKKLSATQGWLSSSKPGGFKRGPPVDRALFQIAKPGTDFHTEQWMFRAPSGSMSGPTSAVKLLDYFKNGLIGGDTSIHMQGKEDNPTTIKAALLRGDGERSFPPPPSIGGLPPAPGAGSTVPSSGNAKERELQPWRDTSATSDMSSSIPAVAIGASSSAPTAPAAALPRTINAGTSGSTPTGIASGPSGAGFAGGRGGGQAKAWGRGRGAAATGTGTPSNTAGTPAAAGPRSVTGSNSSDSGQFDDAKLQQDMPSDRTGHRPLYMRKSEDEPPSPSIPEDSTESSAADAQPQQVAKPAPVAPWASSLPSSNAPVGIQNLSSVDPATTLPALVPSSIPPPAIPNQQPQPTVRSGSISLQELGIGLPSSNPMVPRMLVPPVVPGSLGQSPHSQGLAGMPPPPGFPGVVASNLPQQIPMPPPSSFPIPSSTPFQHQVPASVSMPMPVHRPLLPNTSLPQPQLGPAGMVRAVDNLVEKPAVNVGWGQDVLSTSSQSQPLEESSQMVAKSSSVPTPVGPAKPVEPAWKGDEVKPPSLSEVMAEEQRKADRNVVAAKKKAKKLLEEKTKQAQSPVWSGPTVSASAGAGRGKTAKAPVAMGAIPLSEIMKAEQEEARQREAAAAEQARKEIQDMVVKANSQANPTSAWNAASGSGSSAPSISQVMAEQALAAVSAKTSSMSTGNVRAPVGGWGAGGSISAPVSLRQVQAEEENIRREQAKQQTPAQVAARSGWAAAVGPPPPSSTPSLRDIQQQQEVSQQRQAQQQQQQQQQQSAANGPAPGSGPWAAMAAQRMPAPAVSPAQISMAAPSPARTVSGSSSNVNQAQSGWTGGASAVHTLTADDDSDSDDGVWDYEDAKEEKKPAAVSVPSTTESTKAVVSEPATEFGGPAPSKEFDTWCKKQLTALTGTDDMTLIHFVMTLSSPAEAKEYMVEYLGESARSFAEEFLRRRQFEAEPEPGVATAAASSQPVAATSQGGSSKSKKKKGKKKGGAATGFVGLN